MHREVLMLRSIVCLRRCVPQALCCLLVPGFLAAAEPSAEDLTSPPPALPVQAKVTVELLQVSQIQDHEETFNVEFFLYLTWRDPRLVFDAEREGRAKRFVSADKIWTPQPQLMDDLEVDVQSGDTAHVRPDGTVLYRQYYRGTIAGDFDLHDFPFDRHTLSINIEAAAGDVDSVVFYPGGHSIREGTRVVPHGWKLLNTSTEALAMAYPYLDEKYSRHVFRIQVEREPHYYWWAVVLPLLPIVATSWLVFWMDPKEFSSQVGVGVTAILTVVAYRISIDSSLPPLSYMTRMDYFLIICQAFVFASFLMSVVAHVCHALDTAEMVALAGRINVTCRWAPPVLMMVACGLLLTLRPALAMSIEAAVVLFFLLWIRPSWSDLKRWTAAIVHPERQTNRPSRIQECLIQGPHSPASARTTSGLR